jgi:hypothetical protein
LQHAALRADSEALSNDEEFVSHAPDVPRTVAANGGGRTDVSGLAVASEAYQAQLEHHRLAVMELELAPERQDFVAELAKDVERARKALEVAWLNTIAFGPAT